MAEEIVTVGVDRLELQTITAMLVLVLFGCRDIARNESRIVFLEQENSELRDRIHELEESLFGAEELFEKIEECSKELDREKAYREVDERACHNSIAKLEDDVQVWHQELREINDEGRVPRDQVQSMVLYTTCINKDRTVCYLHRSHTWNVEFFDYADCLSQARPVSSCNLRSQ